MARPLSADELRKLGCRNAQEREAFRRKQDSTYKTIRSSKDNNPQEGNWARRILDRMLEGNWHPRTPSEKARVKRLEKQADELDRQMQAEHQAELDQLEREADPKYQEAKELYLSYINGIPAETPEAINHYAQALGFLTKGNYLEMSASLGRGAEDKLAEIHATAAETAKAESDAKLANARAQADAAKADLAAMQPPGISDGGSMDRVADQFEDPRI